MLKKILLIIAILISSFLYSKENKLFIGKEIYLGVSPVLYSDNIGYSFDAGLSWWSVKKGDFRFTTGGGLQIHHTEDSYYKEDTIFIAGNVTGLWHVKKFDLNSKIPNPELTLNAGISSGLGYMNITNPKGDIETWGIPLFYSPSIGFRLDSGRYGLKVDLIYQVEIFEELEKTTLRIPIMLLYFID